METKGILALKLYQRSEVRELREMCSAVEAEADCDKDGTPVDFWFSDNPFPELLNDKVAYWEFHTCTNEKNRGVFLVFDDVVYGKEVFKAVYGPLVTRGP